MNISGSVSLPNQLFSNVGSTASHQLEEAAKTRRAFEAAQAEVEKIAPAKSAGQQSYEAETANTLFNAQSIAEQFKEYMDKSPEELMREQILRELGYSEEELAGMSPEDRQKAELEILERIKIKIEMALKEKGLDVEINTASQPA
jgi:hypothetical protein